MSKSSIIDFSQGLQYASCTKNLLENPGYVLTAVKDFTISTKIITHNNEEENEQSNLEPKSSQLYNFTDTQRNGVLIVEYQDPSDGEIDNTMQDIEEVDIETSMEPLETMVKEEEQKEDTDPFVIVEEKFGGQNISLVLLPRFPAEHPLSSKQRFDYFVIFDQPMNKFLGKYQCSSLSFLNYLIRLVCMITWMFLD